MNKINVVKHLNTATRFVKLKEMLGRFNLNFEERIEGNTVVIDIKAKPQNSNPTIELKRL